MDLADDAVSAGDRALDVAEHRVEPAERRSPTTAGARHNRNVHSAGVADTGKHARR